MDCKLFVKNLPADIKEQEVRYIFSKYGNVARVDVVPGVRAGDVAIQYRSVALAPVELHLVPAAKKVREDQSCAFVIYETTEAASTAIRVLNGVYRVRSSSKDPISVRLAYADELPTPPPDSKVASESAALVAAQFLTPKQSANVGLGFSNGPVTSTYSHVAEKSKCKLFIGNLHPEITQAAMTSVFSTWGQVVHVHIKTGRSKFGSACAFVELARPEQAEIARLSLHQKYDARIGAGGAPIQVTYFQSGGGGKR